MPSKPRDLLETHFSADEVAAIRRRSREAIASSHGLTDEEYEACRDWVMRDAEWSFTLWLRRRQRPPSSRWALKFWITP